MRFFTLSSTFSRMWFRVGEKPASELRSVGANSTSNVRSPARNASSRHASSEPAGVGLAADGPVVAQLDQQPLAVHVGVGAVGLVDLDRLAVAQQEEFVGVERDAAVDEVALEAGRVVARGRQTRRPRPCPRRRLRRRQRRAALPELGDARIARRRHRARAEVGADEHRVRSRQPTRCAWPRAARSRPSTNCFVCTSNSRTRWRRRRRATATSGSAVGSGAGTTAPCQTQFSFSCLPSASRSSTTPTSARPCGTRRASCAATGRAGSSRPARSCSSGAVLADVRDARVGIEDRQDAAGAARGTDRSRPAPSGSRRCARAPR
jgi:hypothetical protein